MRVEFKIEKGYPYLIIKYEQSEWERIENILKTLNLEKAVTKLGFGKNLELEYYRERDTELLNYLKNYFKNKLGYFVDDINRSIFENGYLNIAIFRVVPSKNNEVKILLDKYLTVAELKDIINKIKQVFELLLNIAIQAQVNINVVEEKK
jgi:hypothetical protein